MKLIPTGVQAVNITLYQGVPFDNKYKEHTFLSKDFVYNQSYMITEGDKSNFLNLKDDMDRYYYPRTEKTGTFNFAYGNGLVTSVVLELDDNEINSNYMRVYHYRAITPAKNFAYYYFITDIVQKNESTYILKLELDVIQTFGEEFLENMKDKPVMVERKHCTRVSSSGNPVCSDIAKNESLFSGVKANIVTRKILLRPNIKDLENDRDVPFVKWVYFIFKTSTTEGENEWQIHYRERDITYPYYVKALPLIDYMTIFGGTTQNPLTIDYDIHTLIKKFSQSEECVKIVISPYPPFEYSDYPIYVVNNRLFIDVIGYTSPIQYQGNDVGFSFNLSVNCEFYAITPTASETIPFPIRVKYLTLTKGYAGKIPMLGFQIMSGFGKVPNVLNLKNDNEFKIALPPFRQYYITSLSTQATEFSPQLRFNKLDTLQNIKTFFPYSIVSTNPASNFVFTSAMVQDDDILNKVGDGGNLDYSLPNGANAYEHFMNSAMSEYQTSKIVSGITNALKIGIGIAGVAVGGVMGKVAGVAGIGAGAVGIGSTIADYNAKMQDLKNTSVSFNLGGSSFTRDYAMCVDEENYNTLFPFFVEYETDKCVIESASDYFYEYGYEVNRDCYFNTELYRGSGVPSLIDNNIFNRSLFNYVKINDDITTKCIGSNLPLIVAKKFNEIFNNGIKLWTFFGFDATSKGTNIDQSDYNVFNFFQKHTYDNAEYYGEEYNDEE